ncbi:related to asparaginyl-tRNA synthetase (mitochondrial) [Phialocephala subalpina]|uniref:asparagine--tRNA ligase n=1 Tax=Phialocephala subalpina TaxID=576137 RepID=A0A1L7WYN2_9HELO|nr:related to asparaginyl-tRNA synthetase (mitochondrial) [Phialocephala subalpina]
MVQHGARLVRCLGQAFKGCRAIHTKADNSRLTIARILEEKPADPTDVVVTGFIRSIRNQKQRSFASIGDGSSLEPLQALLTPAQAQSLSTGTAVRFMGSWRPSPNPKAQSHELHVVDVDIIGPADPATFPLQKKYHTPEYLRTMPHMRTRIPINSTLLRLRSDAIAAVTSMFYEHGFAQTHTPIITSSDCEGAGEVFNVGTSRQGPKTEDDDGTFFRAPKYLTVSSQLHLEALAQSVGNVWTLSPTFRAEKSDTARHLSEFYMLEAEVIFTETMDDVMQVVQNTIGAVTKGLETGSRVGNELLQNAAPETELLRRWRGGSRDFPRVTYTEAIRVLQSSTHQFEHEPKWCSGLQAEHERYIANELGNSSNATIPVFVTHYPKAIKPFYMLPSATSEDGLETVDCFDLLVPEACEIVGGSMREHRLEPLIRSMQANKMIPPGPMPTDEELGELKWYVDLRKWGSVPHGGFGLGFDRLLAYLAGVPNIREVVTFPRWVGRCDC